MKKLLTMAIGIALAGAALAGTSQGKAIGTIDHHRHGDQRHRCLPPPPPPPPHHHCHGWGWCPPPPPPPRVIYVYR